MADLKIHKFTYSPAAILAMSDDRRSSFLLLGLFLNEVNWLQKLLIMGMPDERHDPEPVMQSNLSLAILMTKLLAGKIHAGGERLRDQPLRTLLSVINLSKRGRELELKLVAALEKNSTIHRIRKSSAFHYPRNLTLAEPLPAQEELALYLTPHVGDALVHLSDLATVEALVSQPGMNHKELIVAFDLMLHKVIDAAGIYTEFLVEVIKAVMDEIPEAPIQQELLLLDAEPLDAVRPKFFALPVIENSNYD